MQKSRPGVLPGGSSALRDKQMVASRRMSGFWCRQCDRNTRLTVDGRRCACHPLHGEQDLWEPPAWCRQCDQTTRMFYTEHGASRCHRCHPMGRPPQSWPLTEVPEGIAEQTRACEWLCFISPTLRRVGGADYLYRFLRMWFDHGWTPNDIVYALDVQPDGQPYGSETPSPTSSPQVVQQWLRRRLEQWRDLASGLPYESVSAQVIRNREALVERQLRQRAELDRQRDAAADAAARAAGLAAARKVLADVARRRRVATAVEDARQGHRLREELSAPRHCGFAALMTRE